jgi:hypothetical protein
MPCRIVCNGTEQKSLEARSELGLTLFHFTPFHKTRDGIDLPYLYHGGLCNRKKWESGLW